MNIFRLLGDISHLASFFFLLKRLHERKSSIGLSYKTLELFLIVFVCRYLDLFTTFVSLYNSLMKVTYIGITGFIVYLMRYQDPFKSTYEAKLDTYLHWKFAAAPAAVLGLVFNETRWGHYSVSHNLFEVIWAFSIWLEALAILPQLILLQRHGCVEALTSNYIATLGAYRAFYILNWVYRHFTEPHFHWGISLFAGLLQTAFYADFFWYWVKAKRSGEKHVYLPS